MCRHSEIDVNYTAKHIIIVEVQGPIGRNSKNIHTVAMCMQVANNFKC